MIYRYMQPEANGLPCALLTTRVHDSIAIRRYSYTDYEVE